VLLAHTRDILRRSCAESAADAVALAYVSHGSPVAERLAGHFGARIVRVVTRPDGTVDMTVASHCGMATSAAVYE
jgi:hypothetical protein